MARTDLTAQRLREFLDYDPCSGIFKHKTSLGKAGYGKAAGRVHSINGYVYIGIDRHRYFAHRLAWLYMTGAWPNNELDHVNRIRADNRFENLREASHSHNNQNKTSAQSNNKLKMLGVSPHRKGFQAAINVGGKQKYLGIFKTPQDASDAYWKAKHEFHPGYAP